MRETKALIIFSCLTSFGRKFQISSQESNVIGWWQQWKEVFFNHLVSWLAFFLLSPSQNLTFKSRYSSNNKTKGKCWLLRICRVHDAAAWSADSCMPRRVPSPFCYRAELGKACMVEAAKPSHKKPRSSLLWYSGICPGWFSLLLLSLVCFFVWVN